MDATRTFPRRRQGGFTLMELMVGMAIGMLATVVIIQVMSLFDAQRRSTTGSADAQTNGGIALYSIAREVQMAGYGLLPVTDSALECTTINVDAGAGVTGITGLAPIFITEGASSTGVSASDKITIRYASSLMGGAVAQITAMSGNDATVGSTLGCQANDITIVSAGTTCAISKATAVTAAGVTPAKITLQDATNPPAASGANIGCMGTWNEITYEVDPATGNLLRKSRVNGVETSTPSVVGVVNLQAQYGVSATANSNQITSWVNASGGWAAPAVADRNRIKAIRVAVVARNAKRELEDVTAACASTGTNPATGLCAWQGSDANPAPAIDLSQGDAGWKRYRYRVFETIIPLRNTIWAKDTL